MQSGELLTPAPNLCLQSKDGHLQPYDSTPEALDFPIVTERRIYGCPVEGVNQTQSNFSGLKTLGAERRDSVMYKPKRYARSARFFESQAPCMRPPGAQENESVFLVFTQGLKDCEHLFGLRLWRDC